MSVVFIVLFFTLSQSSLRIIGGSDVGSIGSPEITWHVSIMGIDQSSGKGIRCGGSILDSRHILTAGHCVRNVRRDGSDMDYFLSFIRIRTGIRDSPAELSDGAKVYMAESVYVHPRWTSSTSFTDAVDMAIIRVSEDIVFSQFVQPVLLPPPSCSFCQTPGAQYIVSGYGHTMPGAGSSSQLSTELRYVRQMYASNTLCRTQINVIPFNDFCVQPLQGQVGAICTGDSGGPLVIGRGNPPTYTQVGIVSARIVRPGEIVCDGMNEFGLYESVSQQMTTFINPVLGRESGGITTPSGTLAPQPHSGSGAAFHGPVLIGTFLVVVACVL